MDDELQRRALESAMRFPGVIAGDLGECWDELWLALGEELGWQATAKVDAAVLRAQIERALRSERLRREGWPTERIEADEALDRSRALVAATRLPPGEEFDVFQWVGPLLNEVKSEALRVVQRDWRHGHLKRHPADYVSVWEFQPRYERDNCGHSAKTVASMLTELGAPATCRALRLFAEVRDDRLEHPDDMFDPGAKLPLLQALEIAIDHNWEQDEILLCLPGRLAYVQTHERGQSIVHRPE
jgi:hypothetical protein